MANKKPLKLSETYACAQQFETGDTIAGAFIENGVPVGGTAGQVLEKIDGTDYNTQWATPTGGGGGDSLGTGFTSGGGSGTIPDGTVITADGEVHTSYTFVDYGIETRLNIGNYADENGAPAMGLQLLDGTSFSSINVSDDFGGSPQVAFSCYNGISGSGSGLLGTTNGVTQTAYGSGYNRTIVVNNTGIHIGDTENKGASYDGDYSDYIATNDRSIPDVGTVNLLKQTPVSYDNASAPNNCIFYSTTDGKLSYKDPGGTVNNLY